MQVNLFDSGESVASGGYRFPLTGWREYYTLNVLGTHAITHEAFCKEFPEAAAALEESDRKNARLNKMLENPQTIAALTAVIEHLDAGKEVHLAEAAAETPEENKKDVAPESPAEDAVDQATDGHTHKMSVDAQGNGTTDEVNGHTHQVQGGQCMAADGHTHEMPEGE